MGFRILKANKSKYYDAGLSHLRTPSAATSAPASIASGQPGLSEMRSGHQVRIFYMFLPGRRIVLLDGIIKKTDDIPKDDLKRVRQYKREVEGGP